MVLAHDLLLGYIISSSHGHLLLNIYSLIRDLAECVEPKGAGWTVSTIGLSKVLSRLLLLAVAL
jgi:hypothetical protein